MAIWHQTYTLSATVPVQLRTWGNDGRRGSTCIIQHSGHGSVYEVILGGSNIDPATDSYGHRLSAGESIVLTGDWNTSDAIYALTTAEPGHCHVLIVGA